jgi:hypothetical protein
MPEGIEDPTPEQQERLRQAVQDPALYWQRRSDEAEAHALREQTLRVALTTRVGELQEELSRMEGRFRQSADYIMERFPDLTWSEHSDVITALCDRLEQAEAHVEALRPKQIDPDDPGNVAGVLG